MTSKPLFPFTAWHYWLLVMTVISVLAIALVDNYHWLLISIVSWLLLSTLGTHIGLHRYFTHKSFYLNSVKEKVLAIITILSYTGDPIGYACTHVHHHSKSDTPQDAQSWVNIGVGNCLVGRFQQTEFNFDSRADLNTPFYHWLNRNCVIAVIILQAVLFLINWKLAIFGLVIPQVLSVVSLLAGTVLLVHTDKLGYKNFNTNDLSTNSPIAFMLATGEAWHNNHHANPRSPTTQVKWWEIDPVYWIICLIRSKESN